MISFANAQNPDVRDIVLEMNHITKHDRVVTLEDLSLDVRRGEIVTLLGPAGSGKSTVLRIAAGLERTEAGDVFLSDNAVDSHTNAVFAAPINRNVGLVLPTYAIWPHMTVASNVSYPLAVRRQKGPEVRERVSGIIEQVGLGGMEQRPAVQLDRREQLLLAIARALATSPDVVLMDDPLSALSTSERDQMRAELRLLQRRLGVAMLIATRDEIEALSLSDRIVVMEAGVVKQVGTPVDLYTQPSTADVRDRMGRAVTFRGRIASMGKTEAVVALYHDGPEMRVAHVHGDVKEGCDCTVTVRPVAVDVVPMSEAPSNGERTTIPGIIAALLFVGDRYEATIELPWRDAVRIDLSLGREWREGQPVAVLLSSDDLHLWPAPVPLPEPDIEESPAVEAPNGEGSEPGGDDVADQTTPSFRRKLNMRISFSGLTRRFNRR